MASHFEQGCRKESWSRSTVILNLLAQPFINSEWQSLRAESSGLFTESDISWPESSSTDSLQHRLEIGTESGRDLAIAAYNLSSLCAGDIKFLDANEGIEALQNRAGSMNNYTEPLDFLGINTV